MSQSIHHDFKIVITVFSLFLKKNDRKLHQPTHNFSDFVSLQNQINQSNQPTMSRKPPIRMVNTSDEESDEDNETIPDPLNTELTKKGRKTLRSTLRKAWRTLKEDREKNGQEG